MDNISEGVPMMYYRCCSDACIRRDAEWKDCLASTAVKYLLTEFPVVERG